mgnify:CR=1 FL=1
MAASPTHLIPYQQEGEPLTEMVLHPHFQRLSW